jgi:hypothetical protein
MIKKIPDLPNNILGFAAKGTITEKDYESVIIPAVENFFFVRGRFGFSISSAKMSRDSKPQLCGRT